MDTAVIGTEVQIPWDLLLSRFPEISLALSLDEVKLLPVYIDEKGKWNATSSKGLLHAENIEEEVAIWKNSMHLEGIDILYVYGIGLGHYYEALQGWLSEGKDRAIVFFEEDLRVIKTLLSLPIAQALLQDPKVHIQMIAPNTSWNLLWEDCIRHFISDQVDFTALASYAKGREKKIKKIRLQLLRKSALMNVAITELLHYDKLMENISINFSFLPSASHVNAWQGICSGIPAIICGAGVSLAEVAPRLKELENKALIIAGGSAITALHHFGVRPHLTLAFDPNEEEYLRIKASSCFELPFVYSSRLHKDVLRSTNVRPGYLCADTGGAFETWMHEQLSIECDSLGVELGQEALSVTTLAVPLARYLGCGPILFCGVDLSYKNLHRYPPGVVPSARVFLEDLEKERRSMEKLVRKKNGEGRYVYSLVKWIMEASCLDEYVKRYSNEQFFCSSRSGLVIPSVAYLSFDEFMQRFCAKEYDIRGQLHAISEIAGIPGVSKEEIQTAFTLLRNSLDACIPLVQELLFELERKNAGVFQEGMHWQSGKMQVLEMDIMQESAYQICLSSILAMYRKILERRYPGFSYTDSEKAYREELSKQRCIWEECLWITEVCKSNLAKAAL